MNKNDKILAMVNQQSGLHIMYSKKKEALVFVKENATPDFWDNKWNTNNLKKIITGTRKSRYWSRLAKKYLPDNAVVLEGGCGTGHLVDALGFWGYKSIGIDFAEKTVNMIKSIQPNLNVLYGDVRSLPFEENTFDGYFSLGVIEHFWDGYGEILEEMKRVIKPGGYLFLSFPCISRMDNLLRLFNRYSIYDYDEMPDGFYQFALEIQSVKSIFEKKGFVHVESLRKGGLLGLSRIHPIFSKINDYLTHPSKVRRAISYFFSTLLSPISSHSVLLVLLKKPVLR
ncbi:MAG: class I SAM-dependent methyltransferase [Planctomycetota bacterium]|nr:class I SAM-dependent methyltransferase [Planctomycetota bacterium]